MVAGATMLGRSSKQRGEVSSAGLVILPVTAMDRLAKQFAKTRASIQRVIAELRHQRSASLKGSAASRGPNILLQAVVEFGGNVDEGQLIEAVAVPWFEIVDMLRRDPSAIHGISPRKLEEMIAGWYERSGFDEVILTPASGDFGRDVIAVKRGLFTVRILDQVKAYKPGRVVTANDVRALVGVLSTDFRATKGIVTTTADFAPRIETDPSIAPLIPYRLELVNGE